MCVAASIHEDLNISPDKDDDDDEERSQVDQEHNEHNEDNEHNEYNEHNEHKEKKAQKKKEARTPRHFSRVVIVPTQTSPNPSQVDKVNPKQKKTPPSKSPPTKAPPTPQVEKVTLPGLRQSKVVIVPTQTSPKPDLQAAAEKPKVVPTKINSPAPVVKAKAAVEKHDDESSAWFD